jgi:hypothetical protein
VGKYKFIQAYTTANHKPRIGLTVGTERADSSITTLSVTAGRVNSLDLCLVDGVHDLDKHASQFHVSKQNRRGALRLRH